MFLSFLFVLLWVPSLLQAQDSKHVHHQQVMFWNVENAFWPEDDPMHDDNAFTPEGDHHWTQGRLRQKLLQLTRVIVAAGNGRAPMLVGLAEVEGDSVMEYWTKHTPLWDQHYQYVVTHGPDTRGIQTALLYQPFDFKLITSEGHRIPMPEGTRPTRDLLHAAGRLVNGDTLDVIVCHLPSKLGGARQSQPARDAAQRVVMQVADSVRQQRLHPRLIIMGDMNETPHAKHRWWGEEYENLMLPLQQDLRRHPSRQGSHKYQGEWGFLDQFIIHRGADSDFCRMDSARVFSQPFMLTRDETHLGHRPKRSYYGYQYEGGYSDHLPILLDLTIYF